MTRLVTLSFVGSTLLTMTACSNPVDRLEADGQNEAIDAAELAPIPSTAEAGSRDMEPIADLAEETPEADPPGEAEEPKMKDDPMMGDQPVDTKPDVKNSGSNGNKTALWLGLGAVAAGVGAVLLHKRHKKKKATAAALRAKKNSLVASTAKDIEDDSFGDEFGRLDTAPQQQMGWPVNYDSEDTIDDLKEKAEEDASKILHASETSEKGLTSGTSEGEIIVDNQTIQKPDGNLTTVSRYPHPFDTMLEPGFGSYLSIVEPHDNATIQGLDNFAASSAPPQADVGPLRTLSLESANPLR